MAVIYYIMINVHDIYTINNSIIIMHIYNNNNQVYKYTCLLVFNI